MGGALPVKYSEYFGAKRHESLKNENIRYDISPFVRGCFAFAKVNVLGEISKM
jgi:hypothetical protein